MHGFHPSSERETKQRRWPSEWNFGLIALLVLSVLAVATALLMPELTP
jgi:4-amino-4-deoxy-L-arabinose transferase-like glycosyltransferase